MIITYILGYIHRCHYDQKARPKRVASGPAAPFHHTCSHLICLLAAATAILRDTLVYLATLPLCALRCVTGRHQWKPRPGQTVAPVEISPCIRLSNGTRCMRLSQTTSKKVRGFSTRSLRKKKEKKKKEGPICYRTVDLDRPPLQHTPAGQGVGSWTARPAR